jgi:hypothetical protein
LDVSAFESLTADLEQPQNIPAEAVL